MSQKEDRTTHEKDTKTSKPLGAAGRGFFVVLTLCIIAVGGVAASTFSDSLKAGTPQADTTTTATAAPTTVTSASPAAVRTQTTTRATTTTTQATTTTQSAASLFVLPLSNQILTYYSEEPIYSETMADYRTHKAIDFKGEEHQSVRALADATVVSVEVDPLWGGCLTLDHGGNIQTVYRGVDAAVTVGTELKVGDTVGTLADIPCERAMGPHLHVELLQNGKPLDISTVLSAQLTPARE